MKSSIDIYNIVFSSCVFAIRTTNFFIV